MKYIRIEYIGKNEIGIPEVEVKLVPGTEIDTCPVCNSLFCLHPFEGNIGQTEVRRLCDLT